MTRIIIEGLHNRASLLAALSAVMETLNHDDSYLEDEHVFIPSQPTAQASEPTSAQTPPPKALTPCPRRGQHHVLTDCWMCWSDVMRGAALEPEVLTNEAWTRDLKH
ncbi:hypothetical protein CFI00_08320 [Nocardioides sp. S5]|uniref:hypothetical protein n=1 Tax=Nocardioides sp. S5 TaxID=2017486 RepID=UPI001A8CE262|nr:hypothetical protein [Nocardioides sp. S5]QSR30509.1 hypothetical protein CFI00_08320 [Nocardioides sp. S5]